MYNLVSAEKMAQANVNVSCFIVYCSKKKFFFSKMAGGGANRLGGGANRLGGGANRLGGGAQPHHALPWLRHY